MRTPGDPAAADDAHLAAVAAGGRESASIGRRPSRAETPLGRGSLTQRRQVVLIVVAASLPLIALVVLGIIQGKQLAEARVAEERVALARAGALTAVAFIDANLSTVRSLSRMREITAPASVGELEQTLRAVLAENPEWDGWGIASPDGWNVAATGAPPGTLNVADRPYFQEALRTGQATVSPAVLNRRNNKPTVALAVPVEIEPHGRSAIVVSLSTVRLVSELQLLRDHASVRIVIVDSEGKLFAHPDPAQIERLPSLRGQPAVDAALRGETGSHVEIASDGTETLVAYAAVPDLGWAVVVSQPTAAAFDVVHRQTLLGSGILGLAVVLAGLISWRLGGRLAELYDRQRAATIRAEEAAHTLEHVSAQSERRRRFFEGVIASAPVAVAILRGREYRHEELNARYQALRPDTPMMGHTIAEVFPHQTEQAMREVFDRVYQSGAQVTLTDRAWQLDPDEDVESAARYFTHIVARLDDEDGAPDTILSVVLETTDMVVVRRRAEREKDELLSTASHELKTPLTSLGLAAQMIDRMIEHGPRDEARLVRHVGTIRAQVARVTRLIGSLLNVSRIDSGQLGLSWDVVDLTELARAAVLRESDALPDDSNHEMVLLAADDPVTAEGDEARLEQVIANLLSNAVKYSPAGGRVEVTVRREGEQAILEVADRGMGVPEHERDRLFAPFSRTATAVDAGVEGTGLGLYISRRIVEAHRGTIEVRDTPGGGATFRMSVPVRRTASPDDNNPTEAARSAATA